MAGKKGGPTTTGNATMQLDAVVDDMEEVEAPNLGHRLNAPPPLPPKRAGARAWLTGAAVVLVAAGAAVGIGMVLRAFRQPSPIVQAAAEAPEVGELGVLAAEESEAAPRVQLDEFVFDSESESEAESEAEAEAESEAESEGDGE